MEKASIGNVNHLRKSESLHYSCESLTRVITFSCQVRSKSSVNFARLSLVFANTTCFQEKGEISMTYVQEWVLLVVFIYSLDGDGVTVGNTNHSVRHGHRQARMRQGKKHLISYRYD
jgi:hypothetical protein